MTQLITFIQHNLVLCLLFIILVSAYLYLSARYGGKGVPALSIHEATLKMKQKKVKVYDIRAKEAFQKGHLANAENHAGTELETIVVKQVKQKDTSIVIICENGTASPQVAQKIKALGYSDVSILEGGMRQWYKDNLPVVSNKE